MQYNQDDWVDHLATAEFVANSHTSESTGLSPFFATKDYLPRSGLEPPTAFPDDSTPEARRDMKNADKAAEKIETLRVFLRQELVWAQAKQVEFANRRRAAAREFKVGDRVMLDTRNIKTTRPCKSLEHKNAGPYKIVRAIDDHAYELGLPESMKLIHPVFHPWFLHLDKSKPLPGQRVKPSPPTNATNDATNEKLDYYVKGIGASRYDMRKNRDKADPSLTAEDYRHNEEAGKMLQYQIVFTGYTDYNNKPLWEDYYMANGALRVKRGMEVLTGVGDQWGGSNSTHEFISARERAVGSRCVPRLRERDHRRSSRYLIKEEVFHHSTTRRRSLCMEDFLAVCAFASYPLLRSKWSHRPAQ